MLTGNLVRLRPLEASDLDRNLAWVNDPEVTQWVSIRYPMSRPQEEEWLSRAMKRPASEELTLAIETLTDSRHIGTIGLGPMRAEDRKAELGIMIGDKTAWSHGYGTDAILTMLRFAFDEINLHRVSLYVLDGNDRAIACYRKCGFLDEGRLRQAWYAGGRYHDLLVMAVLEDEFRALHPGAGRRL